MLAAVAFVAFGCVALYTANEVWAMATMALTVIVLLVAILGVIHLHPKAFYVGMCVFGWSYLLLTYGPTMRDSVRPLAVTDGILDLVYDIVQRAPAGLGNPYGTPDIRHFRPIGHSLFALVFAIIGGVVGQWFSCNTVYER